MTHEGEREVYQAWCGILCHSVTMQVKELQKQLAAAHAATAAAATAAAVGSSNVVESESSFRERLEQAVAAAREEVENSNEDAMTDLLVCLGQVRVREGGAGAGGRQGRGLHGVGRGPRCGALGTSSPWVQHVMLSYCGCGCGWLVHWLVTVVSQWLVSPLVSQWLVMRLWHWLVTVVSLCSSHCG